MLVCFISSEEEQLQVLVNERNMLGARNRALLCFLKMMTSRAFGTSKELGFLQSHAENTKNILEIAATINILGQE